MTSGEFCGRHTWDDALGFRPHAQFLCHMAELCANAGSLNLELSFGFFFRRLVLVGAKFRCSDSIQSFFGGQTNGERVTFWSHGFLMIPSLIWKFIHGLDSGLICLACFEQVMDLTTRSHSWLRRGEMPCRKWLEGVVVSWCYIKVWKN